VRWWGEADGRQPSEDVLTRVEHDPPALVDDHVTNHHGHHPDHHDRQASTRQAPGDGTAEAEAEATGKARCAGTGSASWL
jgi:hypothetical protein